MAAEESQLQPVIGMSAGASVPHLTPAQLHRLSRHIQMLSEVSPFACSMPGKLSCIHKDLAAWHGPQGSIAGLVHNARPAHSFRGREVVTAELTFVMLLMVRCADKHCCGAADAAAEGKT